MHALTLLQRLLSSALGSIHEYRRRTLWVGVSALLSGGVLTLTELGRAAPGKTKRKHSVKRIERFLGNKRLHAEQITIYRGIAQHVLGGTLRPRILVDWTPVHKKLEQHALVASVAICGRSVIIYEEVHPEKLLSSPKIEKQFLKRLQAVLPKGCIPTIVTDAGFRTPWFDAVEALGWDFVGRLRHRTLYQDASSGKWKTTKSLHRLAMPEASDLGEMLLTKSAPRRRRLIIIKTKSFPKRKDKPVAKKRRKMRKKKSSGKPHQRERQREAAKEPWLLVTSHTRYKAKRIVKIYATRMQIEQTFRSLKSHRFGWSFDYARSQDPRRLEILLLIGALASLVLLLTGLAAQASGLDRDYQANTVRDRRVFAAVSIGRILIRDGYLFPKDAIKLAQIELRRQVDICEDLKK